MVTVSLISHTHGSQILSLLNKLNLLCPQHVRHVILTINVPELELTVALQSLNWNFELTNVFNRVPKGFGANHNAAFEIAKTEYFCVINPDIDFSEDPFPGLISCLQQPLIGCSFPVQMDESGHIQDYARRLPSPSALLARYLFPGSRKPALEKPDWVNGAFMLFSSKVFGQLHGFDDRYFMYCEDVDICIRLRCSGYELGQTDVSVTHPAHRNSRVKLQHLFWHISSLVRLWCSAPYRRFLLTESGGRDA